jgi:hypothetical protein
MPASTSFGHDAAEWRWLSEATNGGGPHFCDDPFDRELSHSGFPLNVTRMSQIHQAMANMLEHNLCRLSLRAYSVRRCAATTT